MLLGILFNLLKKMNQIFEISVLDQGWQPAQSPQRPLPPTLYSPLLDSSLSVYRLRRTRQAPDGSDLHSDVWRHVNFTFISRPDATATFPARYGPGSIHWFPAPPYLLTDILRHRWKILGAELIFPPEDRPPQFWPSRRKSSRSWRRWRHEIETSDANREPVLNEWIYGIVGHSQNLI